eukprot:TRINITY_DN2353_c1_g2_i1.p1 TRINITY_DN2353_c1_g2~~TRINITY_DN2353_c1_g2_i1.p1  ORF type:complete len:111 (+),score=44.57 TRINITY_DN2353_c1_g2_i1:321-653(+)
MIIYEVNLEIQNEVINEYQLWLNEHISQLLNCEGFIKAQILKSIELENSQNSENKTTFSITVQYFIKDLISLQNYLKNDAPRFRQDGINRFGGKFTATRRVFETSLQFNF